MCAIVAGRLLIALRRAPELGRAGGPRSSCSAACLAWGLDNNLTRKVSLGDASWIAMVKGLVAGTTNLALALVLGASWPALRVVLAAGWSASSPTAPASRFSSWGCGTGHRTRRRVFFGGAVLRRAACDPLGEPLTWQLVVAGR